MSDDLYPSDNSRSSPLTFNGYSFSDDYKCLLHRDGTQVALRAQCLELFRVLVEAEGRVLSRTTLIETVWADVEVTDDSLTQCISQIRKAIDDTDHETLLTVPRQGYRLIPDAQFVPHTEADKENPSAKSHSANTHETNITQNSEHLPQSSHLRPLWLLSLGCILLAIWALWPEEKSTVKSADLLRSPAADGTPQLYIRPPVEGSLGAEVLPELNIALNRYRTLLHAGPETADYTLALAGDQSRGRLTIELHDAAGTLVFAQGFDSSEPGPIRAEALGKRVAAAIASPGVGVLDRELIRRSQLKPIDALSEAECFAYGFGCAKCSGEEDNITKRAEACLAHLIEKNPENARAWGLQATIHAHRYWWGNTLEEPERSHLELRKPYREQAIAAANRAESLSDGTDSAIYWGQVEAWYASCETDKMRAAMQRGLEINPDDPSLLAAFGNWLSYSGYWDEGATLTTRALELEPQYYKKWWWMGLAKTHYFHDEFEAAYADFLKAFNDRNWVSHLQMAYTLPRLGRLDEARAAVKRLESLHPGITLEKALEMYSSLCFPESFLEKMRKSLVEAGLPSRGSSTSLYALEWPRTNVIEANGFTAEYIDEGEGEPVIFVHGMLGDYRTLSYYLVPISERYRFISYSRRYFGTQDWLDEGEHFSLETHTADLIALIEALDTGPVHVVSWSSAGPLVLNATLERPDLFKSAVYYEPVDRRILEGQEIDEDLMEDWSRRWGPYLAQLDAGDVEGAAQSLIETVFLAGPGGFENERESFKEVARQNARTLPIEAQNRQTMYVADCDLAGESMTPSLVIKGEETHYYYRRQAELYAQCLGSAELITVEGVNHRGMIDAVDQISSMISNLIEAER